MHAAVNELQQKYFNMPRCEERWLWRYYNDVEYYNFFEIFSGDRDDFLNHVNDVITLTDLWFRLCSFLVTRACISVERNILWSRHTQRSSCFHESQRSQHVVFEVCRGQTSTSEDYRYLYITYNTRFASPTPHNRIHRTDVTLGAG